MYYVYVLISRTDKRLYTGSTGDLRARLEAHNKGLVEAAKNRIPLDLVYYEACLSRHDAFRREKYLKTSYGKRYLKSRLSDSLASYSTGRGTMRRRTMD
jgi:putative endonuclease